MEEQKEMDQKSFIIIIISSLKVEEAEILYRPLPPVVPHSAVERDRDAHLTSIQKVEYNTFDCNVMFFCATSYLDHIAPP